MLKNVKTARCNEIAADKKKSGDSTGSESGMTLIETLGALALLGVIFVSYISGPSITFKATMVADEQSIAGSLARSQMEWVKTATYVSSTPNYAGMAIPSGSNYTGYSANISAEPLNTPDNGIQKITFTIVRNGKSVINLDGYKVNR